MDKGYSQDDELEIPINKFQDLFDKSDQKPESIIIFESKPIQEVQQRRRKDLSQNDNMNQNSNFKSPSSNQKKARSLEQQGQFNVQLNTLFVNEQNQRRLFEIIRQAKFLENKYIAQKLNDEKAIQKFLTEYNPEQMQQITAINDDFKKPFDFANYSKNTNSKPQDILNQSILFDSEQKSNIGAKKNRIPKSLTNSQIDGFDQSKKSSFTYQKSDIVDDPHLYEKQCILESIYEIIKRKPIISATRKHSILEVALILCLLYLPQTREGSPFSDKNFKALKERYRLTRTFEGFKRKFTQILHDIKYWGDLKCLKSIYDTLCLDYIDFTNYYIDLDIATKKVNFPNDRRSEIKEFVSEQKEQNKQIVVPILTKKLQNYVSFSAQQIDEDRQEFNDDIDFLNMILKLIPLAL